MYSVLVSLLVMQHFESWIGHQGIIQLLELSQRCSVVLGSSLGQNVNTEVRLMDLVVVRLLVFSVHLLTLLLQVHECSFELFLFFLKSGLDDLSASQQSLLQVLELEV